MPDSGRYLACLRVFVSSFLERREHYGCGDRYDRRSFCFIFALPFLFRYFRIFRKFNRKGVRSMEPKKDAPQALTEQEKKLLTMLRSLEYGELRVVVQAGRPVRVEEIRRSVQL